VFLSTRVVMMAARPGRIVEEFHIDEPYPRKPEFMVSARFAEIARQLQDIALGDTVDVALGGKTDPRFGGGPLALRGRLGFGAPLSASRVQRLTED
jgi:hypothetical protein